MPPAMDAEREGPVLPLSFTVPEKTPAQRLDAVLSLAFPEFGVRARRRLWDWCHVLVNSHARQPGFQVTAGDIIRIEARKPRADANTGKPARAGTLLPPSGTPEIVAATPAFVVLHKPEGLHSAAIRASRETSLEELLAAVWAELWQAYAGKCADLPPCPCLLTRLDKATSGLVLAARSSETEAWFREEEKAGRVQKTYVALLRGRLESPLRLARALDTAHRVQTRVLEREEPDVTRHTVVEPVACLKAVETASALGLPPNCLREAGIMHCTVARVRICRGARHQIRAHIAEAGFPLLGEWLYAPPLAALSGRLFLHHGHVILPGCEAARLPEWLSLLPGKFCREFPERD